jgi:hypothetical protein
MHALPHAPQLAGSVSIAMQTLPHVMFGAEHPASTAFGSLYGLASAAPPSPRVTSLWCAPGPSIRGVLASPQPAITNAAENPMKPTEARVRSMLS